jgi:hypothetical protein
MLRAAPGVEQEPPGLPWLASTHVKPRSGLATVTCCPMRTAAVRAARRRRTLFALVHETPFATTIQAWPEAVTTPQLVEAPALEAPIVATDAHSALQSASLPTAGVYATPVLFRSKRCGTLTM